MSDLISRSDLLKCFCVTKDGRRIPEVDCDNMEVTVSIKDVKKIIRRQPTIEAVPVVYGKWIPHKRMARSPLVMNYACSVCGKDGNQTNFCPNCGAKMDGGKE